MDEIVIPATEHSPALHVHVNPTHNLYHYLASEAQRLYAQPNPAMREAAILMAQARFPKGNQGIWSVFEQPLAAGGTIEEAVDGLTRTMTDTAR